jgi:hypothetical protein
VNLGACQSNKAGGAKASAQDNHRWALVNAMCRLVQGTDAEVK